MMCELNDRVANRFAGGGEGSKIREIEIAAELLGDTAL